VTIMIGLEVHVPLPTRTKLFCPCPLPTRETEPNTNVCPTFLGHPGSKPRPNRRAVEMAVLLAKALGCRLLPVARFARKTYFYPDMGKNFQITQYEEPVAVEGRLEGPFGSVRIRRVQVEEDPARIVHAGSGAQAMTLLDYNRSGSPLVEVVTEPDLKSPEDARAFLAEFRALLDALGLLPEEANVRADCNVSLAGGVRVEVKNVHGLRNAERAIAYEVRRQTALRERGLEVARATMHFDDATGTTAISRMKEAEEDYGYIVEPDLPPIPLGPFAHGATVPDLPFANLRRLVSEFGVSEEVGRVLAYQRRDLLGLAEALAGRVNAQLALRWVAGEVRAQLEKHPQREPAALLDGLAEILGHLMSSRIGDAEAKRLVAALVATGKVDAPRLLAQDTGALDAAVREVFAANAKGVADAKRDEKALNFLVGLVMKRTKGQYDPKLVLERCRASLS
jgi:aspartyl-tRNA(Asn)/glutamyl-tRNA(Gln) amidotransferase subunit B